MSRTLAGDLRVLHAALVRLWRAMRDAWADLGAGIILGLVAVYLMALWFGIIK